MIDQVKIGGFLKDLRKKKGLTQEQLAEKFGVSSRSVSRWENGNTMPELGILVELAEYYEVDIKEIIDGERNYAEAEKRLAVKRKCIVTFLGTMVFALCIIIGYTVLPKLPEDSFFRSNGLWLGIGILGLVGLWAIIIHENHKNSMQDKQ